MVDLTMELKTGDRFRFEKAIVEARKITQPMIIQGSKTHRTKRVICDKSGSIFIDKEWILKGIT